MLHRYRQEAEEDGRGRPPHNWPLAFDGRGGVAVRIGEWEPVFHKGEVRWRCASKGRKRANKRSRRRRRRSVAAVRAGAGAATTLVLQGRRGAGRVQCTAARLALMALGRVVHKAGGGRRRGGCRSKALNGRQARVAARDVTVPAGAGWMLVEAASLHRAAIRGDCRGGAGGGVLFGAVGLSVLQRAILGGKRRLWDILN